MNRSIDWDGDAVVIIDQTHLPEDEVLLPLREVEQLAEAIQSLRVRGAPALGVAGALGVALAVRRAQDQGKDVQAEVKRAAALLLRTRPTAANLRWGIEQVSAALAEGPEAAVRRAIQVLEADIQTNRKLAERGTDWLGRLHDKLHRQLRVLTHCNTGALACVEIGTALGVIQAAYKQGLIESVIATETRPRLQGAHLTAWELQRLQIPFRLIVDGAAPMLISRHAVDVVIVGADRIAANGDVANKVGTYGLALAAREAGIPMAVAAPESTVDEGTASGEDIPIENRPEAEVLQIGSERIAPPGTRALNPAFDVTPAHMVSAIVTEERLVEPATALPFTVRTPVSHGG